MVGSQFTRSGHDFQRGLKPLCPEPWNLPEPHGSVAMWMSFTVDLIMRVSEYYKRARAKGWPVTFPWRVTADDLVQMIDGLLCGLVDRDVVQALADVAGIEPLLVPQPPGMYLRTGQPVSDLLSLTGLTPIPDAGTSLGANLVADPSLDLSASDDRQVQVDAWVQQIALDAGLRGMERVLANLR